MKVCHTKVSKCHEVYKKLQCEEYVESCWEVYDLPPAWSVVLPVTLATIRTDTVKSNNPILFIVYDPPSASKTYVHVFKVLSLYADSSPIWHDTDRSCYCKTKVVFSIRTCPAVQWCTVFGQYWDQNCPLAYSSWNGCEADWVTPRSFIGPRRWLWKQGVNYDYENLLPLWLPWSKV